jgi:hypothetical protein
MEILNPRLLNRELTSSDRNLLFYALKINNSSFEKLKKKKKKYKSEIDNLFEKAYYKYTIGLSPSTKNKIDQILLKCTIVIKPIDVVYGKPLKTNCYSNRIIGSNSVYISNFYYYNFPIPRNIKCSYTTIWCDYSSFNDFKFPVEVRELLRKLIKEYLDLECKLINLNSDIKKYCEGNNPDENGSFLKKEATTWKDLLDFNPEWFNLLYSRSMTVKENRSEPEYLNFPEKYISISEKDIDSPMNKIFLSDSERQEILRDLKKFLES